jgi:hypothetical protein
LNNNEFTHLKCQVGDSNELKERLMEVENESEELIQSLTKEHQQE